MKNIYALLVLVAMMVQGCKNTFDLLPEGVVDESQMYRNVYDADAAIIGIYGKFLGLAEPYLLLNELRGDLMDVALTTDSYLQELNTHRVSGTNPYINPRPFYEVILNCNDALRNFDIMLADGRLKYEEYAPRYSDVGALRSWLYLQLGIHFGRIPYVTHPLENVDDVNNTVLFEHLDFDRLLDSLVLFAEKLPFTDEYPTGTSIVTAVDNYNTSKFFIHKNMLLGDLYLWQGKYTQAASRYRIVMELGGVYDNPASPGVTFFNTYRIGTFTDNTSGIYWKNIFLLPFGDREANFETIWLLPFDKAFRPVNPLIGIFEQGGAGRYLVKPSAHVMTLWREQMRGLTPFDIRGEGSSYNMESGVPVIRKFTAEYSGSLPFETTGKWVLYRAAALHLRFAEAANMDGEHKLAYAFVNQGIKNTFDPTPGISGRDVTNIMNTLDRPYPYNFDAREGEYPRFRSDWYRHMGVRGRVGLSAHVISRTDSARFFDMRNADPYTREVIDHNAFAIYIENMILEETGLELAYEGYRWADLLRVARRREKLSPGSGGQWLSTMMNKKFGNGAGGIATDLSNPDNWYLPFNWE